MIFSHISFAFYILGILFAFKRETSYALSTIGSLFAAVTGLVGTFYPFTLGSIYLLPKIYMSMGVDHTSGIFITIAGISWVAISIYSIDYGKLYPKDMGLWLNLSMIGMMVIMMSGDGLTFMTGWEIMTVSSFLLILKHKGSLKEAFEFLAFGELSTVSLMIAFASIFLKNGNFTLFQNCSTTLFLIASTLAFIVKMGIFPFHTWLIGAHAKAPSNVSALLSAPLTLMGVYGIARVLSLSGYSAWWGVVVLSIGAVSASWGAMQAAAERSLKKLPAYSTVENNGIILTAIGLSAMAGAGATEPMMILSRFAFLAALFVTFSHTMAKTLLFMSVGHAKEALQEEDIDNVRGIWSNVGSMPAAGILTSGLSFSAFPPTIGFVGEWMILEALFQSYKFSGNAERLLAAFAGILIALAIGLASFSMIKLIGYTALGPDHGKKAHQFSSARIKAAEIFLIALLLLAGIFSPYIIKLLGYSNFLGGLLAVPDPLLIVSSNPIFGVVSPTMFVVVVGFLFIVPYLLYHRTGKSSRKVQAWNGGLTLTEDEYFTVPAYSFILEFVLRKLYLTKEVRTGFTAEVTNKDAAEYLYEYLNKFARKLSYFVGRTVMNGRISLYILYIVIVFVLAFLL